MGIYDVVRFEGIGGNWLLFKYRETEFNTHSKLIVGTGQVAIIVHNGKIEKICEAGTHTLDSEYLPFLKGLTKAIYSGKAPYVIEIYFINKRLKLDFLWGTSSPINVIDPVYGVKLRLRARGQFGVRLTDYQYFFQTLVGTLTVNNFITFDIIRDYFKGYINQKIKKLLATQIVAKRITYFDIALQLDEIQGAIEEEVNEEIGKYGFTCQSLAIEDVSCPEEDLEHLNRILNTKAELNQLGEVGYRTVRGYDVLESAAENQGTAGAFIGMGVGMGVGKAAGGEIGGAVGGIIPPAGSHAASQASTIYCPNCHKPLQPGAKFCSECGTAIITKCPQCGKKVEPGTKFCPECGTKLI